MILRLKKLNEGVNIMAQLLHECPDCGWTEQSNKCCQLCPKCSSLDVVNSINPKGETVQENEIDDDDDYKHWTVQASREESFFSEFRCGFAR
jgi:acetone carboxylase gamma subunit